MFIYFKGPKPTVDILLDDLYLGEILQRPDWKEISDALIDKHRKRNVRFRFVLAWVYYSTLDCLLLFISPCHPRDYSVTPGVTQAE